MQQEGAGGTIRDPASHKVTAEDPRFSSDHHRHTMTHASHVYIQMHAYTRQTPAKDFKTLKTELVWQYFKIQKECCTFLTSVELLTYLVRFRLSSSGSLRATFQMHLSRTSRQQNLLQMRLLISHGEVGTGRGQGKTGPPTRTVSCWSHQAPASSFQSPLEQCQPGGKEMFSMQTHEGDSIFHQDRPLRGGQAMEAWTGLVFIKM